MILVVALLAGLAASAAPTGWLVRSPLAVYVFLGVHFAGVGREDAAAAG